MHPTRLSTDEIETYVRDGHWTLETTLDLYARFAVEIPNAIACRDERHSYTWGQLDTATDQLAANLIGLGIERDARALVQMASSCREMVLRIAFKKAGIIGAFGPLQWRRKELDYVRERIKPELVVISRDATDDDEISCLDNATTVNHRIDLSDRSLNGWIDWTEVCDSTPGADVRDQLASRAFAFDEVSLITVSSGTSGLAKLCEWPEGAQSCMGRVLGERLGIRADDRVGIFSPMSGAAGLLVWTISAATPCTCVFPSTYHAAALLDLVEAEDISVITTVPVILARLAAEDLSSRSFNALRVLRVGTAAADVDAARSFEDQTGCQVIIASGSMECPGFGHAHVTEPKEVRLDGSVGLPLDGCRLRIEGGGVPPGTLGELNVSAPFAASGYWDDPVATKAAWTDGWYATGDIGVLDENGRLTLQGRIKEVINRSGHKILPAEIEAEIAKHPNIFDCAVIGALDKEYGEVPWAFVQLREKLPFEADEMIEALKATGLAHYKIPARFIAVTELPRVSGNKIDKKNLLQLAT